MKKTQIARVMRFKNATISLAFLLLTMTLNAATADAGKPNGKGGGKGGDETPPPPVTYSIQWITGPEGVGYKLLDINNNGWASGQINTSAVPYSAVMFTPNGEPVDLNLQAPLPTVDGYYMAGGFRINDIGVVVGRAYNPTTDHWQNYRYMPAGIRDVLPVSEMFPGTTLSPALNSFGDVACLVADTETVRVFPLDSTTAAWDYFPMQVQGVRSIKDFNDQLQLLYLGPWADDGNALLYKYGPLLSSPKTYYLHTSSRMNNHGDFVSRAYTSRLRSTYHIAYDNADQSTLIFEKAGGYPTDINDAGVVIGKATVRNSSYLYVYFPSVGTWDLDDLVNDGGDGKWQSANISLAAINNNGQIAGTAVTVSSSGATVQEGFILTPITP